MMAFIIISRNILDEDKADDRLEYALPPQDYGSK